MRLLAFVVCVSVTAAARYRKRSRRGAWCGSDDVGYVPQACSPQQYCQRLDPFRYQCLPRDPWCGEPQLGVEFTGHLIDRMMGQSIPQSCCNKCHENEQCVAYTQLTDDWGRGNSTCILWGRVDAGKDQRNLWATSAFIDRTAPCAAPSHAMCGRFSSGMTCCPTGEFCQPFGDAYHQCQRVAPQCSRPKLGNAFSYTNIYVGLGLNAEVCCEACAMTPGCDAYTYDYYEGGRGECALKKSTGGAKFDATVHSTIRTTNATTCCEACANTPPCKAFTIEKDSCLLFASVGPRRNHSTAVSGVLNPFFT
ncbi:hypothetical protein ATCC90586_001457 [Pythium insidiosum]|nr:hypothetical protein ATCC90586_001457 [Pythium insidiosum]